MIPHGRDHHHREHAPSKRQEAILAPSSKRSVSSNHIDKKRPRSERNTGTKRGGGLVGLRHRRREERSSIKNPPLPADGPSRAPGRRSCFFLFGATSGLVLRTSDSVERRSSHGRFSYHRTTAYEYALLSGGSERLDWMDTLRTVRTPRRTLSNDLCGRANYQRVGYRWPRRSPGGVARTPDCPRNSHRPVRIVAEASTPTLVASLRRYGTWSVQYEGRHSSAHRRTVHT